MKNSKFLKSISGNNYILGIIAFGIIISMVVGIKTIQVTYVLHKNQLPIENTKSNLESNFTNFDIESFGIYPRTFKVVSATKSLPAGIVIFTSSRDTPIINEYLLVKHQEMSQLKKRSTYDLSNIVSEDGKKISLKYWVFDLQNYGETLYVSYVSQPQSLGECDNYRIAAVPIISGKLRISNAKVIWKFSECVSSFPNNPGWHDFQGRLSVTADNVYMTAGLLVSSTYQGFYPNPLLNGLLPTLEGELARDKLFGGLLQVNKKSGNATLFATGFRGPSGIAIKENDNFESIWVADHGPRGGDELNLVLNGRHYGWPRVSYGTEYFDKIQGQSGYMGTLFGNHDGFTKPKYYWIPSVAPSQMAFLSGNYLKIPTWDTGDILMGSLKAESLFHIKLNDSDFVESVEQIPIGSRIRDLSIEKDTIIMSTDDGQIIALRPNDKEISVGAFPAITLISSTTFNGNVFEKAEKFLDRIGMAIHFRFTKFYRTFTQSNDH